MRAPEINAAAAAACETCEAPLDWWEPARVPQDALQIKMRADGLEGEQRRGLKAEAGELAQSAHLKDFNERDLVAAILAGRGFTANGALGSFLTPNLSRDLPAISQLKNFERASALIIKHILAGNTIGIVCDYDTDGTCGGTIMALALKAMGANVELRVPDRNIDSYGLGLRQIKELADARCALVIAVDIGTKNRAEVSGCRELGMETIVIDHHIPADELGPGADAFINPMQSGCAYAGGVMSAGALAWVVCCGVCQELRRNGIDKRAARKLLQSDLLALAAIATIGDVSSLTGANRALVSQGLKELGRIERPGLVELLRVAHITGEPSADDIGFGISPRINAVGRIARFEDLGVSGGQVVTQLLSTTDLSKAKELALLLNEFNRGRQKVEEESALKVFAALSGIETLPAAIVVGEEGLHQGTLGIVAARVMNRFRKTTALITGNGEGIWRGSVRSVAGDNTALILDQVADLLDKYGGHAAAGGFGIRQDNIEKFKERFTEAVAAGGAALRKPYVTVDGELSITRCQHIRDGLMEDFKRLAPFGRDNPSPLFLAPQVQILYVKPFKGRHLMLTVREGQDTFVRGVMWHGAGYTAFQRTGKVDLVYRPIADRFQEFHDGVPSVQIEVAAWT